VHPARDWNIFLHMTNSFGVLLHPADVRWAAAEGVSEDVIAAVRLLPERSVEEIAPKLSAAELEQVIKLVGRSPSWPRQTMLLNKETPRFMLQCPSLLALPKWNSSRSSIMATDLPIS